MAPEPPLRVEARMHDASDTRSHRNERACVCVHATHATSPPRRRPRPAIYRYTIMLDTIRASSRVALVRGLRITACLTCTRREYTCKLREPRLAIPEQTVDAYVVNADSIKYYLRNAQMPREKNQRRGARQADGKRYLPDKPRPISVYR